MTHPQERSSFGQFLLTHERFELKRGVSQPRQYPMQFDKSQLVTVIQQPGLERERLFLSQSGDRVIHIRQLKQDLFPVDPDRLDF